MILIGEKINGSIPKIGAAIAERNEACIRELAKTQTCCGASCLDVCASVSPDKELETLKWLVNLVQMESDLPICLDSPNAGVFAEAITFCEKPGIVNSISMEGDKIAKVFPVIADTEWQCVALLCDNTGIPDSAEKRLEVFERILEKAGEYGIAPARLYVDPVVEMLASSEEGALTVFDTIRKVKTRCPDVHITSGSSNISFQLPLRRFINRSFILLCMGAGMDSAILDPADKELLALIYAAEALLGRDEMCMEYIGAYRDGLLGV